MNNEIIIKFIKYIKRIIPNFLKILIAPKVKWSGDFNSWDEVINIADGYDSLAIFDKVCKATLSILKNEAIFERDSVLFYENKFNHQILSCLLYIGLKEKGVINVLDFGGSLGSTYFQNREIINEISRVRWNIVEQPHYVEFANKNIKYPNLFFYYKIEDCLKSTSPHTIIFSSVLPYLKNPLYLLRETIESKAFKFIIIDRTGFVEGRQDRLTLQKVPKGIIKSSYPCWFFNKNSFEKLFNGLYKKIMEFDALGESNINASYKGMIYERL